MTLIKQIFIEIRIIRVICVPLCRLCLIFHKHLYNIIKNKREFSDSQICLY